MMYELLKELITKNNAKYQEYNDKVAQITENTPESELLIHERWQFIHDYATEIHDILVTNINTIEPSDVVVFDMIPYLVWNKMTLKDQAIVKAIATVK